MHVKNAKSYEIFVNNYPHEGKFVNKFDHEGILVLPEETELFPLGKKQR